MPYSNISQLPINVKNVLPKTAQRIFMRAFDSSYGRYGDDVARKIAWSAVKKKYKKSKTGKWVKREWSIADKRLAEKVLNALGLSIESITNIEVVESNRFRLSNVRTGVGV